MARVFTCVGVCTWLAVLLGISPPHARAQSPAPPTDSFMTSDADGLPQLYSLTTVELQRVLKSSERWVTLPRSISGVMAQPHLPPTFEMNGGPSSSRPLATSIKSARASFQKSWNSDLRLIYNSQVLQVDGDDVLLASYMPQTLQIYSGVNWNSYRALGATSSLLAKRTDGIWCLGSIDGLQWLQDGTLETIRIPGWPNGVVDSVVADGRGRILAWSSRNPNRTAITLFADGKWSTLEAPRKSQLTLGGIRADGSVVLAGQSELIIANPPKGALTEVAQLLPRLRPFSVGKDQTAHLKCLAVRLAEGSEKIVVLSFGSDLVSGTPAVTRDGATLFAVHPPGGSQVGLIRMSIDGPPEWIPFDPNVDGYAIYPAYDNGFYLIDPRLGIYVLKKDSNQPQRVADRREFLPTDQFLGSDREGRIYLRRADAVLALAPEVKSQPASPIRELLWRQKAVRTSFITSGSDDLMLPYEAAVDSNGAVWFLDGGGNVMKWSAADKDPQLHSDRLTGATQVWPGRGGEVLFTGPERVCLVYGKNEIATARSLEELAEQQFDVMLAAAPVASRDDRRLAPPPTNLVAPRQAAPWLTVGKSLWITNGKAVQRLRKKDGEPDAVELTLVKDGVNQFRGPLPSGSLILSKFEPRQHYQNVRSWFVVAEPNGAAEVKPLAVTDNPTLYPPGNTRGEWMLDAEGCLWMSDSSYRSYRFSNPDKWSREESTGQMQFTDGQHSWSYRNAGVCAGFDVTSSAGHRPYLPTYLQHLTPLFTEGDRVACLTPLGAAWIRKPSSSADKDAVVSSEQLAWDSTPAAYIGHAGSRVFVMTTDPQTHRLVTFEMPK